MQAKTNTDSKTTEKLSEKKKRAKKKVYVTPVERKDITHESAGSAIKAAGTRISHVIVVVVVVKTVNSAWSHLSNK